jgi:hypothetical protein
MKQILVLASAAACLVSACTIREERTVQAPATAVVAPAPANVVYTDTPATTTTTVYRR